MKLSYLLILAAGSIWLGIRRDRNRRRRGNLQDRHDPIPQGNNAEQSNNETAQFIIDIRSVINAYHADQRQNQRREKRQRQKLRIERRQLRVERWTFAAIVVYAGLTYCILQEMKSSSEQTNKIASEAIKANNLTAEVNRPYVSFGAAPYGGGPNSDGPGYIKIFNVGKTSATILGCSADSNVFKEFPKNPFHLPSKFSKYILVPGANTDCKITAKKFSPEKVAEINEGGITKFYIYGIVRYQERQSWHTRDCYYWVSKSPIGYPHCDGYPQAD